MLCSFLRKSCNQQCHSAVDASSYNNLPRVMCPQVQQPHDCYRVTNNFPRGSEAFSTKRNSHLALQLGQKPMAEEDIGPSGEATAVVLLNRCDVLNI